MSVRIRLRLGRALALAALAALALPAAAAACNGGWTTTGIQTQLMCPTCHQRLDYSESPIADHIRQFIVRSCRNGLTSTQVKDRLVAQFGPEILAAPPKHGFDLLAWLVPAAVLAAGVLAAALVARAWARRRAPPAPAPGIDPELAARIDADLERLP
jgi:cytochrome c-type biogenesis protein CcmH